MDPCVQALFGSSLSVGALLVISEALPFIRQISGNSITEVVIFLVKRLFGIKVVVVTPTIETIETIEAKENENNLTEPLQNV